MMNPTDAGTNVGDEGGFAPNLSSVEDALNFIVRSIEAAGYKPGQDIVFSTPSPHIADAQLLSAPSDLKSRQS